MKTVMWFREIGENDLNIVGGKGLNLGLMTKQKFPIPPGFVVTTDAYWKFLDETKIKDQVIKMADSINVDDTAQLENTAKQIRELILNTKMPEHLALEIKKAYIQLNEKEIGWLTSSEEERVAVRSSASAEDLPSISENEHVLIKINGAPIYSKMKDIFDKIGDGKKYRIEIPAMKGNKIYWARAETLYKHNARGNTLYKIRTKTGREITVAPNHSLIILDEDILLPKNAKIDEIKKGTKIPAIGLLPESENKKKLTIADWIGTGNYIERDNRIFIKNNDHWKTQNSFPSEIIITEKFAYLIGIYLAEGSTYKNNCTIITNSNKAVMKNIKNALAQLGLNNNQKINKNSIRIYCPALVELLNNNCGMPKKEFRGKGKICSVKKIPDFAFGWSKKNLAALLRGCFDGDGTIGKRGGISYCTTSEMLAGGLLKLLEIQGLDFYIKRRGHKIDIKIPEQCIKKFVIIGFDHSAKKRRLEKVLAAYSKKEKHPEFKYGMIIGKALAYKIKSAVDEKLPKKKTILPICPFCKEIAKQTSYYNNKKRYFCRCCRKASYENEIIKRTNKRYVYFDSKGRFKPDFVPWNFGKTSGKLTLAELKKISKKYGIENFFSVFEGNVRWDEIEEITPVTYNGYVYDFTVPGVENFAAGIGGIITHNSASFAGQQETYLNVFGQNSVVENVKKCWASLFTARATYYRKKNNFETSKVGIAVVVQKMVNSESAGVMFTSEPTGDREKIVIEAAYGLGEIVVSGSTTPDHYVVDKYSLHVLSKNIANQEWMLVRSRTGSEKKDVPRDMKNRQKLADDMITELAEIGKMIEYYYNKPQDIEWAVEKKRLYIVQSRAITTLGLEKQAKDGEKSEIIAQAIVTGLPASPGIVVGTAKIIPDVDEITKVNKGDILVTKMTNPDWVPIMQKSSAIVTDEGGATCHAAIVSRELGIPCVVGTRNAMSVIKDDEIITVDGYRGKVYRGKVVVSKFEDQISELKISNDEMKKVEAEVTEEIESKLQKKTGAKTIVGLAECAPCMKDDDVVEKEYVINLLETLGPLVKVNVALPSAAESAAQTGAAGVGLLRAEHMITATGEHPAEFIRNGETEKLVAAVREGIEIVAKLFRGKPVWYRTFDARSDEFRHLKGGEKEPREENPMLGWHGVRRDMDDPSLLNAQFAAIKQLVDEGYDNIGIMVPFLINVDELRNAKEIAKQHGLDPKSGKIRFGVMVETPAAVWIIDELIEEGIDFISFGTNDLTQLTLGIDRDNGQIQRIFSELHPAVLREIAHVIKKCKAKGVETSICGQAGSNPEMVKKLIRMGIDSVSANIDAVEKIRMVVVEEEKKMLLERAGKKLCRNPLKYK